LSKTVKIKKIDRIIPGRIDNPPSSSSYKGVSFSYFTDSGMKWNMKGWGSNQELFIVCKKANKKIVKKQINKIVKELFG